MKIVYLFFQINLLSFALYSCTSKPSEIEKLRRENSQLKAEVLELRAFKDSLKITAYIDNTTFETTVNEPYYIQLFTIIQDDMEIESIYINGKNLGSEMDSNLIKYHYTDYGPRIIFNSDTAGLFNFKVNAKFNVWDDKIVPLSWPIEVKKK